MTARTAGRTSERPCWPARERPLVDTSAAERGLIWNAFYSPCGFNDYITVAKLFATGGTAPVGIEGDYGRVIGRTFKDYLDDAQTGVVWVSAAKHAAIYGNLFDHNGHDSYKHNIYIKTQRADIALPPGRDLSTQEIDVGWNELRDATSGTDRRGGVIFVSKEGHDDVAALPTHNVCIHDNRFCDGDMDFIHIGDSTAIGDVYVFNNTLSGGTSTNGGMAFYRGSSEVFLYNNSFYRIGPADEPMAWGTGAAHLHSVNNIWYPSPGQEVFHLETGWDATFASDHDLYFEAAGATLPTSGDETTVTNSVPGDPAFADAKAGDFHLLATGSNPARDAGTASVDALVAVDADGNAQPQGATFDIGAFEYVPRCVSDSDCDSPPECRSAEDPTCNDSSACEYGVQPDGEPCGSDANACTDDVCDAGTCTHAGHAGLSCSGGEPCTTPDTCNSAGECVPGPDTCGGCAHLDGDGDGDPASPSCTHAELDCNDGEVLVHPGAIELCNFMDDDCDGATDELYALGAACTVGVGACAATGVYVCNDAQNGTLCDAAAGAPTAEVCGNDIDEDCDGVLDNGCTCEVGDGRPCYGGPAGTEAVGGCQAGTQSCPSGTWSDCVGQVLLGFEVCGDGLDNDCNGLADADDLAICGTGCTDADEDDHADLARGGDDCNDGDAGVHPGAAEVCGDDEDNNCDGLTDDEDVVTCGSDGDVVGIGCQCAGDGPGGLAHSACLALLALGRGLRRRRR